MLTILLFVICDGFCCSMAVMVTTRSTTGTVLHARSLRTFVRFLVPKFDTLVVLILLVVGTFCISCLCGNMRDGHLGYGEDELVWVKSQVGGHFVLSLDHVGDGRC
jgi:hypothetical protein